MRKFPPPSLIGVDFIDKQHALLVDLVNRLVDDRTPISQYIPILSQLGKHLASHFSDEATHMASSGFPFMGTHLVEHSILLARFNEIYSAAENNKVTTDQIMQLATDTVMHIEQYDVLYAAYYAAMSKDVAQLAA